MTTDTIIKVEDLHKSFGDIQVLKGISAELQRGSVTVIIGPSGSGKSTFLRCLNLLEEPTGGKIYINGEDITAKKANVDLMRRRIGMVFQHFNLFPHKTILENMTLAPIKLLKKTKEAAR